MSEHQPESPWRKTVDELSDNEFDDMSYEERVAWYLEYMKTVPEENVMMISGMPMEINDDPAAFKEFVTAFQQLKRQGMV